MPSRKKREGGSGSGPRKPDAARTRQDILRAAREEFAEHGLSGARVDAIAARMRTTKRMLYYYFGSKEGLYLAVLEQVYGDIRSVEQELDLASLKSSRSHTPHDRIHLRLRGSTSGIHSPGQYREHSPRAPFGAIQHTTEAEPDRDRYPGGDFGARATCGRLPLGHRRGGPASDDQRVLLFQGFESAYIRDIVRLRSDRAATASEAQADDRRCHNPHVGNNRRHTAAIRSRGPRTAAASAGVNGKE